MSFETILPFLRPIAHLIQDPTISEVMVNGKGKTTLLNALAVFLPPEDRLVVIENIAELQLTASNLVRFEARREQEGSAAVTIRELLKATLRHRPDRIILGEVRGGEAYDLLEAL